MATDPSSAHYPPPGEPPAPTRPLPLPPAGRVAVTTALVLASVALVFPLAGLVAIGFAVAAERRGSPIARLTMLVSIGATVAGFALSVALVNADVT